MYVARSVQGVAIRLTNERWLHITEEHSEMAGYYHEVIETVEAPEAVVAGTADELLRSARSKAEVARRRVQGDGQRR